MTETVTIADVMALFEQLDPEQQAEMLRDAQASDELKVVIGVLQEHAERARQCPHCRAGGTRRRGEADGLARYDCRACGRTYNALTGTPLARLRMKGRWLTMTEALVERDSVRKAAARCGVHRNTALRWRHKFLKAVAGLQRAVTLGNVTELDLIEMRESEKGSRSLKGGRKPRKRGGPKEEGEAGVPVLTSLERGADLALDVLENQSAGAVRYSLGDRVRRGTIVVTDGARNFGKTFRGMGIHHERVNLAKKQRVRGPYHVQGVNSIHARLRAFFLPFHGVATKYLPLYLQWFRIPEHHHVSSRFALLAAIVQGPITARA